MPWISPITCRYGCDLCWCQNLDQMLVLLVMSVKSDLLCSSFQISYPLTLAHWRPLSLYPYGNSGCQRVNVFPLFTVSVVLVLCQVDEADNTSMISSSVSSTNSFTVYTNSRCLVVAASSPDEKSKWMKDLRAAVAAAPSNTVDAVTGPHILYPSLKSNSTTNCILIIILICTFF